MKKLRKLLALTCALVLLGATAFPSSAAQVGYCCGEHSQAPTATLAGETTVGTLTYKVYGTLNTDSTSYHYNTPYEVLHIPTWGESELEATVEAGVKTWTASGNYDSDHITYLQPIGEQLGVRHSVTNSAHSLYYMVTDDMPKGTYSVVMTCWHYQVTSFVELHATGANQSAQIIYHMPYQNGDYLFVYY